MRPGEPRCAVAALTFSPCPSPGAEAVPGAHCGGDASEGTSHHHTSHVFKQGAKIELPVTFPITSGCGGHFGDFIRALRQLTQTSFPLPFPFSASDCSLDNCLLNPALPSPAQGEAVTSRPIAGYIINPNAAAAGATSVQRDLFSPNCCISIPPILLAPGETRRLRTSVSCRMR